MLTDDQILMMYERFGYGIPFSTFRIAANVYYLMVTRRITLASAVRIVTHSNIGYRLSEVASVSSLFMKVGGRYAPLGYYVIYQVNIPNGRMTFKVWVPFYFNDFFNLGRLMSRSFYKLSGAFSYTMTYAPYRNHDMFTYVSLSSQVEGTFLYQWGDNLCYFLIEKAVSCYTGRRVIRNRLVINNCVFIPPKIPPKIPTCVNVQPLEKEIQQFRYSPVPWELPDDIVRQTYTLLRRYLPVPSYDLFRAALAAYQLMVENDDSLYSASVKVSRFEGIPYTVIRSYLIKAKMVGKSQVIRHPNRSYDPVGIDVMYAAYTVESKTKKGKGTALELRFVVWQPFYAKVPFSNIYEVIETLFNSLGSSGEIGDSIVLGIIRSYGGSNITDLPTILKKGPQGIKENRGIFKNRNRYVLSLVKHGTDGWQYRGIFRYQWEKTNICYLEIETLRLCGRTRDGKNWALVEGNQSLITDTGFAICPWHFGDFVRYPFNTLNYGTVCRGV